MKRCVFSILVAVLAIVVGCEKDNEDKEAVMTMTTSKSGNVDISLEGSGTITIDWGDGKNETHTIEPFIDMGGWTTSNRIKYSHSYSSASSRTIRIFGENITYLECSDNQLTDLNVSKNIALTNLNCYGNQLTSLDVSKNILLLNLQCGANQLTSLDVSKNTALMFLQCAINQITSLNVSNNAVLNSLYCYDNQITSLDVSKNTILHFLQCSNNQLDTSELNILLGTLHDNIFEWTDSKYIYILSNPGAYTCDKNIAKDKGWTVY